MQAKVVVIRRRLKNWFLWCYPKFTTDINDYQKLLPMFVDSFSMILIKGRT